MSRSKGEQKRVIRVHMIKYTIHMYENVIITSPLLIQPRCMPLILALARQSQMDLCIQGQLGLQREFQDSQDYYTQKFCLETTPSKNYFVCLIYPNKSIFKKNTYFW